MADPGFAGALARKYDILQEQADTARSLSNAQAGLIGAQTTAFPDEARAKNAATYAQAHTSNALGDYYGVKANLAPQEFQSEDFLRSAQAGSSRAQAGLFNTQAGLLPQEFGSNVLSGLYSRFPNTTGDDYKNAFSRGTDRVPGKGDGKTDTTPAMLAPGEAVLNRAAAEHLGRGVIDMLNAIGAHKMGLDLNPNQSGGQDTRDVSTPAKGAKDDSGQKVSNQTGGTPGYAKGTSKVPGKGAKGKAPQGGSTGAGGSPGPMSPEIMQAIMQMGGGAGGGAPGMGMPSPQGMPQMPMPMPQVAR
jgi:hypothetical protein